MVAKEHRGFLRGLGHSETRKLIILGPHAGMNIKGFLVKNLKEQNVLRVGNWESFSTISTICLSCSVNGIQQFNIIKVSSFPCKFFPSLYVHFH